MDNERSFKELKIGMELKELNLDRERLLQLYKSGNVYEVNSHIDNIVKKYPLETAIYHATHYMPPANLQERVQNCMVFLDGVIQVKKGELFFEAVKEINNV